MDKQEKKRYAKLISIEINSYINKIYRRMKPKLAHARISPADIVMKYGSLAATRMWDFKLASREKIGAGEFGKIEIVTRGLDKNQVRKQRALFIAAELYVLQAFAAHKDVKYFDTIKKQSSRWSMLKNSLKGKNPNRLLDHAVRYVIEEIGEHKLAHSRGHGWTASIAKLEKHYPDVASIVGSSEETFTRIFRKQDQKFTPAMMKQEEDLIRKEIEDIDHLILILAKHDKKVHPVYTKKLVRIDIQNLKTFRRVLKQIKDNLHKWEVVDKKEHKELKKRKKVKLAELKQLLAAEARAEKIDINKVHLVFKYFEKEKINILNDLELVDKMSAQAMKTHNK
jgi:hypothetical protein